MYYVVWALLFFRQPQYTADRKTSLTYATLWLLVVIPMIAFEVKPYHTVTSHWLTLFKGFIGIQTGSRYSSELYEYLHAPSCLSIHINVLVMFRSWREQMVVWYANRFLFGSSKMSTLPHHLWQYLYWWKSKNIDWIQNAHIFYRIPKAHQEILLPINSLWEITAKILCSKVTKDLIP